MPRRKKVIRFVVLYEYEADVNVVEGIREEEREDGKYWVPVTKKTKTKVMGKRSFTNEEEVDEFIASLPENAKYEVIVK